jgi:hypothetical protein
MGLSMNEDDRRRLEQRFENYAVRFSLARQRTELARLRQSGSRQADIDHLTAIVDWLEKCRQRQKYRGAEAPSERP